MIDFEHFARYSRPMTRDGTLLIVDDDPDVLTAARLPVSRYPPDFPVREHASENPEDFEKQLAAAEPIGVFLLDMNFAIGRNTGGEGLKWLARIREIDPEAVVVLMTAFGDLNTAVEAMRLGAADFVLKPWQNDKLLATLNVAAELRESRATVKALSVPPPLPDMIAGSAAMQNVMRMVNRVAPTDANVLVRGENGTGKELIAQAIHRQSARSERVMVAVDLGAVAESLFESELFGHTKGAFTDASRDRSGRFLAAHRGTLFLDEIGNLPSSLQTKLLRVLESREVVPLGTDQAIGVDVRLIAATNRPLETLVKNQEFREDLLYRINTIEVRLPPLRERVEDIAPLAAHFVALYARKYRLPEKSIDTPALAALGRYRWPGNVRELSHAVERALILSERETLSVADFDLQRHEAAPSSPTLNLDSNEKRLVKQALEQAGGNISHAADALGITRAALYRRIEKFSL